VTLQCVERRVHDGREKRAGRGRDSAKRKARARTIRSLFLSPSLTLTLTLIHVKDQNTRKVCSNLTLTLTLLHIKGSEDQGSPFRFDLDLDLDRDLPQRGRRDRCGRLSEDCGSPSEASCCRPV